MTAITVLKGERKEKKLRTVNSYRDAYKSSCFVFIRHFAPYVEAIKKSDRIEVEAV